MTPTEVLSLIDRFNRLLQQRQAPPEPGYVTPAERHEGRHTAILEARKKGMKRARDARAAANGQAPYLGPGANGSRAASQGPVSRRSGRKGVIGPCS
jgi:hypothetical protein